LVPGNRGPGLRHEVQSFDSVGKSVESYLRNLNTHERYISMRQARQKLRQQDREVTGSELAAHLDDYSERRDAYIADLQSMIRQNNLESE
ncbi:MAG TPA: flagellar biosynthesis protein FlgJ, partial [Woeseiaceae bacterium]